MATSCAFCVVDCCDGNPLPPGGWGGPSFETCVSGPFSDPSVGPSVWDGDVEKTCAWRKISRTIPRGSVWCDYSIAPPVYYGEAIGEASAEEKEARRVWMTWDERCENPDIFYDPSEGDWVFARSTPCVVA